jgi:hypothetical protein
MSRACADSSRASWTSIFPPSSSAPPTLPSSHQPRNRAPDGAGCSVVQSQAALHHAVVLMKLPHVIEIAIMVREDLIKFAYPPDV